MSKKRFHSHTNLAHVKVWKVSFPDAVEQGKLDGPCHGEERVAGVLFRLQEFYEESEYSCVVPSETTGLKGFWVIVILIQFFSSNLYKPLILPGPH